MANADDYVYVNFPSMQAAYEELRKIVTELDKATDDLYHDVKRELGGSWQGQAEEDFNKFKAQWNAREKEMGRQLFQASTAVETAKDNYQQAERANINLWMN